VAAVGFELYCQLIDEAVAELAGRDDSAVESEPVRFDIGVDAYLPASYVPFEAAKIDIHRRIAAARRPGDLRQITDELVDRFGPQPEEVENLITLQQARIDLGQVGAEQVQFRGGKLTVTGIELESEAVASVREQVPGLIYEWRSHELSVRVDNDPAKRLATVSELGRALADMGMLRQS
jgi:transcription-repair coupling factor (superfamily II helicase)